ncbi:MAG: ATP synthase F0 subunit B [Candidatus Dadabacteria bacterium]|nr:ATP synthase F0 subunit B [Candidatus Dadabacteria bacterium]
MEVIALLQAVLVGAGEAGGHFDWVFTGKHAVNLIILLLILGIVLRRPLRNFLVERQRKIANEIEDAKKKIEEARKKFEEYSEKMGKIDGYINSLKEAFGKEAELETQELLAQAETASRRIMEEAREIMAMESARAVAQIKEEIVSSAVNAAERILKETVTEQDKKRLVEEFVRFTEEEKWHQ